MSDWQSYVDQNLVGTGFVSQGAMVGSDGTTLAASPGFALLDGEAQAIIAEFNNPTKSYLPVIVGGIKYSCLKSDNDAIYAKTAAATGITICKTNKLFVIGCYKQDQLPVQCNSTVEQLAAYLRNQGE